MGLNIKERIFRKGGSNSRDISTTPSSTLEQQQDLSKSYCVPLVAAPLPVSRRIPCQAPECSNADSLPTFEHKFLTNAKSKTRLLRVAKGRGKDPLYGEVLERGLEEEPYEALSYRWHDVDKFGDPKRVAHIHIGGCYLRISDSIEEALFLFRRADRSRLLWIDQICIDQSKKDEGKRHESQKESDEYEEKADRIEQERDEQIKIMGKIYINAQSTLIWLGSDLMDTEEYAMKTIQSFRPFREELESLAKIQYQNL